jgi:hypothetical protein
MSEDFRKLPNLSLMQSPYQEKPLTIYEFMAMGAEVGVPEGIRKNHQGNSGLDLAVKYGIYRVEQNRGKIS